MDLKRLGMLFLLGLAISTPTGVVGQSVDQPSSVAIVFPAERAVPGNPQEPEAPPVAKSEVVPQEQDDSATASPQEPDSKSSEPAKPDDPETGADPQDPETESPEQAEQEPEDDSRASSSRSPGSRRSQNGNTKHDKKFVAVFKPIVASMDAATVRITADGEQIALGTVVDAKGLILTKASELKQEMKCEVNGQEFPVRVIGIHPQTDIAMIQVDAGTLNVVEWSDQPTPGIGHWVMTPKADSDEPSIGIISVGKVREIPPSRPFIGIEMRTGEDGVRITKVVGKSPAELAGLQVNDLIYEIEGNAVKTNLEVINEIGQFDVGDRITISLMRFNEKVAVKLTLAERDKVSPESQRANEQNSMGSEPSRRRKDFPLAFEHDSMLDYNKCGGPIVDLSGKVIGINIARAGRVSCYALPVETVLPLIDLLKSGDLSPTVVNREKIAAIELELEEMARELDALPEKKSTLSMKFNAERARQEEIETMIDDLKLRLEEVEKKAKEYKDELTEVHQRLRAGERVRAKLTEELEQLRTGSSR